MEHNQHSEIPSLSLIPHTQTFLVILIMPLDILKCILSFHKWVEVHLLCLLDM